MTETESVQLIYSFVTTFWMGWKSVVSDFSGQLLIACLVLVLESVWVGWPRSSIRKLVKISASTRNDIITVALSSVGVLWLISQLLVIGIPDVTKQLVRGWATAHSLSLGGPLISTVIWFVVYDLGLYWIHRWSHTIPAFWVLHSYHHSANEMTVLTRFRFHPVEVSLYLLLFTGSIAWFAVPKEYMMAIMAASVFHTCLKHSSLTNNWGWLGRYVVASPASHYIHHSNDARYHGCNYATTFQFWDIIFRSNRYPDHIAIEQLQLGLQDDGGGRSQWSIIVGDYLRCLGMLWRSCIRFFGLRKHEQSAIP